MASRGWTSKNCAILDSAGFFETPISALILIRRIYFGERATRCRATQIAVGTNQFSRPFNNYYQRLSTATPDQSRTKPASPLLESSSKISMKDITLIKYPSPPLEFVFIIVLCFIIIVSLLLQQDYYHLLISN